MPYATLQDLTDRFGTEELTDLTDRTHSGVPNTTVVARALADASAQIDGYLAGLCPLPLNPIPDMIVLCCCDLARYALWDIRANQVVKDRRDSALKYLAQVDGGTLGLGLANGLPPAAGSPAVSVSSSSRVFSQTILSDYVG